MKSKNIAIGTRFGNWVVVDNGFIERRKTNGGTNYVTRYRCRCDCGTERAVRAFKLLSNSTSCGCNTATIKSVSSAKHGENRRNGRTRLYRTWDGMIQRCTNPNHDGYKDYGGRGIHVCEEWRDFSVFLEWAKAAGHHDGLEIDRRDNNKGYCPGNCRWVTSAENKRNRRAVVLVTAFGETKCITDWSLDDRCHVTPSTITHRLRKLGWDAERSISEPRKTRKSSGRFVGHHVTS